MPSLSLLYDDADEIIRKIDFSPLKGKSILLTGATGLIGMNMLAVLKRLIKVHGYQIDVFTPLHKNTPEHFNELIKDTPYIRPINGSADFIIHAAGYAQPAIFTSNPVETIRLNTQMTDYLIYRLLKENGKFLFLSSSEVYSGLNKWQAREDDIGMTTPYHPRACYIEGKRCGEAIVNSYRQQGIDAKSARLCLAYGPGVSQGDKRALSTFIDQALTGRLEMKYSGREMRTYCYVQDACEMLWNILLYGKEPVYNVGGKSLLSILDLARQVAQLTDAELIKAPEDGEMLGSPTTVQMSLWKATNEFHKTYFVGLEEGLRRTIEWHRGLNG